MPLSRPIPRVKVINYGKLGELMIRWATEPETRPENLPAFEREVAGAIELPLPTWIKGLQFVQSNNEVLLIRLPPAEFIEDTLQQLENPEGNKYPFPDFYSTFILNPGPHDQKEVFRFRVGDYTIAHCT